eukprot:403351972
MTSVTGITNQDNHYIEKISKNEKIEDKSQDIENISKLEYISKYSEIDQVNIESSNKSQNDQFYSELEDVAQNQTTQLQNSQKERPLNFSQDSSQPINLIIYNQNHQDKGSVKKVQKLKFQFINTSKTKNSQNVSNQSKKIKQNLNLTQTSSFHLAQQSKRNMLQTAFNQSQLRNTSNSRYRQTQHKSETQNSQFRNQSLSPNRNQSSDQQKTFKIKLMDQVRFNRQKFYSNFFQEQAYNQQSHNQNGFVENTCMANINESFETKRRSIEDEQLMFEDQVSARKIQTQQKAQQMYSKYNLKYSGISKDEIIQSPIEELENKIQRNLRQRGFQKHKKLMNLTQLNTYDIIAESALSGQDKIRIQDERYNSELTKTQNNSDQYPRYRTPLNLQSEDTQRNKEPSFQSFSRNNYRQKQTMTTVHQNRRKIPLNQQFINESQLVEEKSNRDQFSNFDSINNFIKRRQNQSQMKEGNNRNHNQIQSMSRDLENISSLDRPVTNMIVQQNFENCNIIYQPQKQSYQSGSAVNFQKQNLSNFRTQKQSKNQNVQSHIKTHYLINPSLNPSKNITELMMNQSVRGRPIKHFLQLVKGDIQNNTINDQSQFSRNNKLSESSQKLNQSQKIYGRQISPRRDELFNQTFQEFKSNKNYVPYFVIDPPKFQTDNKYYYNSQQTNQTYRGQSKFATNSQSRDFQLNSNRQKQTNDWAQTQLFQIVQQNNQLPGFNSKSNLKYFTLDQAKRFLQEIQERQAAYDNKEILQPIMNKALKTLELIYLEMNLQDKFEKLLKEQKLSHFSPEQKTKSSYFSNNTANSNKKFNSRTISLDSVLSLLIRIKLALQGRKALGECFKQIIRFQQLSQDIKELMRTSLDVSLDDFQKVLEMREMAQEYQVFSHNLIETIQDLKNKHNLYKTIFAFERKDYIKYINQKREEIRNLASVFEHK